MELIAVAKIIKPIGIRGEVKIQLLTDDVQRFAKLTSVWIGGLARRGEQEQSAAEYTIRSFHQDAKRCAMSLQGIETVEAAETLRNQFVFVSNHETIQPNAGQYFIDDVIGCEMMTHDGKYVGTIVDVLKLPANDLWVVRNGEKEILIPAVKAIVKDVDVKQKRVVIDSPEGLIE